MIFAVISVVMSGCNNDLDEVNEPEEQIESQEVSDVTEQEQESESDDMMIEETESGESDIQETDSQVTEDSTIQDSEVEDETTQEDEIEDYTAQDNVTEETIVQEIAEEPVEESAITVVETEPATAPLFEGYTLLEVDGGDLSGHREANVVVDIGFGDREYYAFTNEFGQLIKVTAKEIILQDESTEPTIDGRYFPDEAKVSGTESSTLDEGHVIADSLGGVANAYNITPQNSTLNRYGDQAYMEKVIRDAGGCTDFTAFISYPNTTTQIPSHYTFTYTLMGNVIVDDFDNINPNEVNVAEDTETVVEEPAPAEETAPVDGQVEITMLDKKAEYIILKNTGSEAVDLTGWRILSVRGEQSFTFPMYTLNAGSTVKVGDEARNTVDFHWLDGSGTWNNSKSDPAELYNASGEQVDRYED